MGWRGLDGVASPREGSRIMLGIYKRALKMQVGWQGLGRVASLRKGSRIIFGIYVRALKMQVGWQTLGRVASSREGSEHDHLNYVWNSYRSHDNVGGLAGSR